MSSYTATILKLAKEKDKVFWIYGFVDIWQMTRKNKMEKTDLFSLVGLELFLFTY